MSAMQGPPEGRPDEKTSTSGYAPVPPFPDLDGLTPEEREVAVRRHGVAMDLWRLQVTTVTELAKVGAEASRLAVGQALVVNAGGGVALLTLVGNLVGRGGVTLDSLLPRVGPALLTYATGVLLAVFVSVCITLSHNAALGLRVRASNQWRHAAAVLFGMSLSAFAAATVTTAMVLLGPAW